MNSQKFHVGDEKGIAVLLGLFMLFVVTIAGISLVYIAQKDKTASVDSASIRKVAFAANASFKAFESQLQLKPDTVVAILTKYSADTNYKWLLGSTAASALTENKLIIGTSDLKCSARIMAYDKAKQVVQIIGTGYGSGNEQKSVYAMYKLSGVQTATAAGQTAKYVLYIACSAKNFDTKIIVSGDIFFGTDFRFNGSANNSLIHGSIKCRLNTAQTSELNATGMIIDSSVYIGTGFTINGSLLCKSKAGFEGAVVVDNTLTIKDEAWFNNSNAGNQKIDMSGKTIHHSGSINMARVINGTEDNKHAVISDIAEKVGLGSTNDSAWTIDTTGLFAKALTTNGTVTGATLQALYNSCPEAKKVSGYMIFYKEWASTDTSGAAFDGKMIWLVKTAINVNKNFVKMTANSRMLIYAYDGAALNGLGGANNAQFNGLIYLTDHASVTMAWTGNNTWNGAIHLASPTATWQCNNSSPNQMFLVYNEAILTDFETAGVLRRPGQGAATGAAGSLVLTDCKIRPQLVGVRY